MGGFTAFVLVCLCLLYGFLIVKFLSFRKGYVSYQSNYDWYDSRRGCPLAYTPDGPAEIVGSYVDRVTGDKKIVLDWKDGNGTVSVDCSEGDLSPLSVSQSAVGSRPAIFLFNRNRFGKLYHGKWQPVLPHYNALIESLRAEVVGLSKVNADLRRQLADIDYGNLKEMLNKVHYWGGVKKQMEAYKAPYGPFQKQKSEGDKESVSMESGDDLFSGGV